MLEVVSDEAVEAIADQVDFEAAVRKAFIAASEGSAHNAPVLRIPAEPFKGAINVKFGMDGKLIGGKIGTYWTDNGALGLPNHGAATLLLDPMTGFPRAFLAARLLNRLRTAAGNAVAVATLARSDASILALVGAGAQAIYEACAVARVARIKEIRIAARNSSRAEEAAAALAGVASTIQTCSIQDAVSGADIIVTATSAREPLVKVQWVKPGAHISAMGADAVGKQELDPELFRVGCLFADLPNQSATIGEGQHSKDQYPRAIGDVLSGRLPGRQSADDITIFDSSGIAIQDLHVAEAALWAARNAGLVMEVPF